MKTKSARSFAWLVSLSLFLMAVQIQWATETYNVPARFESHTAGVSSWVGQTFRATCDSVVTVSFFCGRSPDSGEFQVGLIDSATMGWIWRGGRPALESLSYRDVGFLVNKGVTRGRVYGLYVSYVGSVPALDAYYDTTGPYAYGAMYDIHGRLAADLCARVVGVNRTDSTFWGINAGAFDSVHRVVMDSALSQARRIGITIDREQPWWGFIQRDSGCFNWHVLDSVVAKAQEKGLRVLLNFWGAPSWAWSAPYGTVPQWGVTYPPRNLLRPFGHLDSAPNFLWILADSVARHYGRMGVHDYEIYNEPNIYNSWRYPDTQYYSIWEYPHDSSGRAKLYVKACRVAYQAIKAADPDARVYTNAVCLINDRMDPEWGTSGKTWLRYYYQHGGSECSDIITWHQYAGIFPGPFIADYDTVRDIMLQAGDGARPVWADEGGIGTHPIGGWRVSRTKQADILVQMFVTGLGERENGLGPALEHVSWYGLGDVPRWDTTDWWAWCGLLDTAPGLGFKPSAYAYQQMVRNLQGLYFNRRVRFADPNVYCYEFQKPGGDTARRTWVLWCTSQNQETVAVCARTPSVLRSHIAYDGLPIHQELIGASLDGKVRITPDTFPCYITEAGPGTGPLCRPDIVIESIFTTPSHPATGDSVWFSARIRNIGNDSVRRAIVNQVTFQVNGSSKVTKRARRGLAPGDTITVSGPGSSGQPDWIAEPGDYLIRAWADPADRFVELREDNNYAYIWKQITGGTDMESPGFSRSDQVIPRRYYLAGSHPNPMTSAAAIEYGMPATSDVVMFIINVAGQVVRTYRATRQKPGRYVIHWDGKDDSGQPVSPGIYFCQLKLPVWHATRSIVVAGR
jgi:hypothetical protein